MSKCFAACRKEFQLRNCGFDHMPPEELVRSQWQSRTRNTYYLIYRWAVALFFIGAVSQSMSGLLTADEFRLYFIYLTNWGILTCMITGVMGAVLVTIWYFHPEYAASVIRGNEMPVSFKIYWAIHNATLTLSFVISIIYWVILHNDSMPLDATNVLTHACNSAIMFLDIIIVAHPIRLYHVIQPLLIGLSYLIFSVIYYVTGGTDKVGHRYIYFVLDWSQPGSAFVTAVGTVALAVVVHIVLYMIFKLRVQINDMCSRKNEILPTSQPASPGAQISMVLSNGYSNDAFKGSTEKF